MFRDARVRPALSWLYGGELSREYSPDKLTLDWRGWRRHLLLVRNVFIMCLSRLDSLFFYEIKCFDGSRVRDGVRRGCREDFALLYICGGWNNVLETDGKTIILLDFTLRRDGNAYLHTHTHTHNRFSNNFFELHRYKDTTGRFCLLR